MSDYVTVRLPRELRDRYSKIDSEMGLGYTSFAEFVKEAIRRRMEELLQTYPSTK